jgi:hypothetical protein
MSPLKAARGFLFEFVDRYSCVQIGHANEAKRSQTGTSRSAAYADQKENGLPRWSTPPSRCAAGPKQRRNSSDVIE